MTGTTYRRTPLGRLRRLVFEFDYPCECDPDQDLCECDPDQDLCECEDLCSGCQDREANYAILEFVELTLANDPEHRFTVDYDPGPDPDTTWPL